MARNMPGEGGTVEESEPEDVTVRVRPSFIIRLLESFAGFDANGDPIVANCGTPALCTFHILPYVFEVEAVGFALDFFNYGFRGINNATQQAVGHSP